MLGKRKLGDLSRCEAVEHGMVANEVEEKHEYRYEVVGGGERRKTLFGFVASLEL
jgi:hypothetical protein